MNDLDEVEAMDDTPEQTEEQAAQPSQLMTILFGLNPVPNAAQAPTKQAEVAATILAAPGTPDDTQRAEDKVRDLLRLVGVDQAINLIREEGGQGPSSHFYVARDPDIYDLLAEDELPEMGREFVRMIGLPRSIELFRALGGVDFPAPRGENNNRLGAIRFDMLAEVVGVDAAKVIIKEYGGEKLYIPKCQNALIAVRNRRIVREFDKGASVFELALKFRLSDRQIEKILKSTVC